MTGLPGWWKNIEGPDTENVAEDPVENPYEGRRIGGRRKEKEISCKEGMSSLQQKASM